MRESARAVGAWARRHRAPLSAFLVLALSLALSALGIRGVWGTGDAPFGPGAWWTLVTVLPGCALVAVRDRIPLPALVLGAGLFVLDGVWFGSVGMLLVLNELLYAATASLTPRGRRRMLVVVVAAVVVAGVVAALVSRDVRVTVLAVLLAFAFLGTPYWWATAVRRAEELAEVHAARAEDAVRLAELRESELVRRERQRMAGDLHDVIAGHLAAVALRSEAALEREPDGAGDRAALATIRAESLESLDEMRSMIVLLRSGEEPLTSADRLDRLPAFVADAVAAGVEVVVEANGIPDLPVAVDQAAARIVRECLVNAAKHAPRGVAVVELRTEGRELAIEVRSTGSAPGAAPGTGLGLATLRERAEALGGRLRAGPAGEAWVVDARLPLEGVR